MQQKMCFTVYRRDGKCHAFCDTRCLIANQ